MIPSFAEATARQEQITIDAFLQRSASVAPAYNALASLAVYGLDYGRGAGVGRRLGVGAHLPLHGP